jgi:hypothetical protein
MATATKMVGCGEENTTSSYMTAWSATGAGKDNNDAAAASNSPRMRLWDSRITMTTTADGGGGGEEGGEGEGQLRI